MTSDQRPGEFKSDPARYREASKPHESEEKVQEAVKAFFEGVGALRVKYHIKDLLMIYGMTVLDSDDGENSFMGCSGFGNQTRWEAMAAFAYGQEKAERQRTISKLLGG